MAGRLAEVDATARTHAQRLLRALAEAEREHDAAQDRTTRLTWAATVRELKESIDRLRLGPFAPTPADPQEGV